MDSLADPPPGELDDDYPMATEALNQIQMAIDVMPEDQRLVITRESAIAPSWALQQMTADGLKLTEGQRCLQELVATTQ